MASRILVSPVEYVFFLVFVTEYSLPVGVVLPSLSGLKNTFI